MSGQTAISYCLQLLNVCDEESASAARLKRCLLFSVDCSTDRGTDVMCFVELVDKNCISKKK